MTSVDSPDWVAAHAAAFALITEALTEPGDVDLASRISEYTRTEVGPEHLAHVLVWHATSALICCDGSAVDALQRLRQASLIHQRTYGGVTP